MVDVEARLQLAGLIRLFISGQISNSEFEEKTPKSKDLAIDEICRIGVWHLYDDLTTRRLKGKYAITQKDKKEINRWILFLKNQQEYVYPKYQLGDALLGMMTFGLWMKRVENRFKQMGDINYWPFKNKIMFEKAKNSQGYLGFNNSKTRSHAPRL